MSSKILWGVIVVTIIVVLGMYFSGEEKAVTPINNTIAQSTVSESASVPAKDSSSDVIVDYLVDGLSSDEEMTTKASLDSPTPSQADSSDSLNTNF